MWGPPKAVGLWPWNSETNWSLQHASVEVAQNTWLVKIVCSGWLLWTLKFAAHKSQSRCEDCNMIPAKTWPSWLPAVQWLLSSYWQWKHTEICRQLPLVQPLVSLVALSDWNQVWIGWPGMSDKLFNTIRIGRAALQIKTAHSCLSPCLHSKQSSLIRCLLAFITNERPLLDNTVIHIKSWRYHLSLSPTLIVLHINRNRSRPTRHYNKVLLQLRKIIC